MESEGQSELTQFLKYIVVCATYFQKVTVWTQTELMIGIIYKRSS